MRAEVKALYQIACHTQGSISYTHGVHDVTVEQSHTWWGYRSNNCVVDVAGGVGAFVCEYWTFSS